MDVPPAFVTTARTYRLRFAADIADAIGAVCGERGRDRAELVGIGNVREIGVVGRVAFLKFHAEIAIADDSAGIDDEKRAVEAGKVNGNAVCGCGDDGRGERRHGLVIVIGVLHGRFP